MSENVVKMANTPETVSALP